MMSLAQIPNSPVISSFSYPLSWMWCPEFWEEVRTDNFQALLGLLERPGLSEYLLFV